MNKSSSTAWLPGFIALGLAWGASFLFIKWGLQTLTPIGVAFWRGALGGVTLLLICLVTRQGLPKRPVEWGHMTVMALLMNAVPGFLFAYGETHVTSIMAGLLNATTPMMTVLVISVAFREQRIDVNQSLGIGVGFIGIAFVTGVFSGIARNSGAGVAALLVATLCYGLAFPYARRYVSKLSYSSTSLATTQICCSAIILAPLALTMKTTHADLTSRALWGMLALGSIGTGVAYIWNLRNVKLAGSAVASTVTYITPVVATVLGVWLVDEPFQIHQLVGGLLVLVSATLVQQRWRPLRTMHRAARDVDEVQVES
jgi:drug/metabolite transporter (DMT)-like permease